MSGKEKIIVGLDVGTTKICAVVGEVSDGDVNIIGIGTHPSIGLNKGVVINIQSTVDSIKKAVKEAEQMSGCEISSVYAGIAGGHITGFDSRGIISIKSQEVSKADVERVLEAAKAVAIPVDREVIHILPQEFIVDDQTGILDPVGMSGVRLEVKAHIVTGAVTSAHNIIKCANRAGLDVKDVVLESIASGHAVLAEEEKELGTALIDIGGGTTDLAVFSDRVIKHTFVLAVGGGNLTKDISIGIKAPVTEAENIKQQYGSILNQEIGHDEIIEITGVGGRKDRKISKQMICDILTPRVEEIFGLIKAEIYRAKVIDKINSGIVITGGSALLQGIAETAENIFNLPARIGRPQNIRGLSDVVNNPMYATGVGLVLYGYKNRVQKNFKVKDKGFFAKIFESMKRWLKDIA